MTNNKRKQKHQLFNTILADTNLSDGAVRVAGALLFLFHNTKTGLCFPSNATVGAAVGMHHKTASKHISELVRAGYVLRDSRFNQSSITDFNWKKGGAKSRWGGSDSAVGMERNHGGVSTESLPLTTESNHGTQPLNLTLPKEREGSKSNQETDIDTGYHGTPDNVQHGVEETATDLPCNPAPDTSPATHCHDSNVDLYAADFEHFWSVYPRREKKEDARTEFMAAVRGGVHPRTIIDKAAGYARSVAGREVRYIALPATWLRDKRWTDDYDSQPRSSGFDPEFEKSVMTVFGDLFDPNQKRRIH